MEMQKCFHARISQKEGVFGTLPVYHVWFFIDFLGVIHASRGATQVHFMGHNQNLRAFEGFGDSFYAVPSPGSVGSGAVQKSPLGLEYKPAQPAVAPVALFCGLSWQVFAAAVSKDTLLQKSCQLSC